MIGPTRVGDWDADAAADDDADDTAIAVSGIEIRARPPPALHICGGRARITR